MQLKVLQKDDGYWLSIDGNLKALVYLGQNHGAITTAALDEAAQHSAQSDACALGGLVQTKGENMINGIHIYQGDCPDEINGSYSRDKNCPCCQALVIAQHSAQRTKGKIMFENFVKTFENWRIDENGRVNNLPLIDVQTWCRRIEIAAEHNVQRTGLRRLVAGYTLGLVVGWLACLALIACR